MITLDLTGPPGHISWTSTGYPLLVWPHQVNNQVNNIFVRNCAQISSIFTKLNMAAVRYLGFVGGNRGTSHLLLQGTPTPEIATLPQIGYLLFGSRRLYDITTLVLP